MCPQASLNFIFEWFSVIHFFIFLSFKEVLSFFFGPNFMNMLCDVIFIDKPAVYKVNLCELYAQNQVCV